MRGKNLIFQADKLRSRHRKGLSQRHRVSSWQSWGWFFNLGLSTAPCNRVCFPGYALCGLSDGVWTSNHQAFLCFTRTPRHMFFLEALSPNPSPFQANSIGPMSTPGGTQFLNTSPPKEARENITPGDLRVGLASVMRA